MSFWHPPCGVVDEPKSGIAQVEVKRGFASDPDIYVPPCKLGAFACIILLCLLACTSGGEGCPNAVVLYSASRWPSQLEPSLKVASADTLRAWQYQHLG